MCAMGPRDCTSLIGVHINPHRAHRVRLYKMGDEISDAKLKKKLQREYRCLSELKQFIFWTSIGREGALHFKELIRQKEMAEHLRESVACGLSVGKAQKMIKTFVLSDAHNYFVLHPQKVS